MSAQYKTSTTVAKAFSILDLMALNSGATVSLSQVSSWLDVSKSTAFRYMTTLEELEVVRREEGDSFGLGPKLIELAGAFLSDYDLCKVGTPFLERLSAQTQETVHLAIPSGSDVIYVAKIDSPHAVRLASHIGARGPMYCTALGKSILAYYGHDRVEKISQQGLPVRTANTLTSLEALRTALESVRATGYAIDDEENEIGVRCAGAPIFDYTGRVIGAISVSGPASRVRIESLVEFGALVRQAGLELSARMGYQMRLNETQTVSDGQ